MTLISVLDNACNIKIQLMNLMHVCVCMCVYPYLKYLAFLTLFLAGGKVLD